MISLSLEELSPIPQTVSLEHEESLIDKFPVQTDSVCLQLCFLKSFCTLEGCTPIYHKDTPSKLCIFHTKSHVED